MPEQESRPKLKAVLDTSILIAAFLRRGGVNAKILKRAGEDYHLYLSEPTFIELERVLLTYRRIRRRYHYSNAEVEEFLRGLRVASEEVLSKLPEIAVIREDPKDDFILACALAAQADYIVSKDHHLTTLKEYQGIKILTSDEFLKVLEAS